MYRINAVYRQQGRYYVQDNRETGKWTFPFVTAADRDSGIVKLVKMLVEDTGTAPLDMKLVYTDTLKDPSTGSENTVESYLVDDWAGDIKQNSLWRWTGPRELLRTGNTDTSTRNFLIREAEKKTAAYQFRKEASGPKEPHRSVSAVIEDGEGKILIMEHRYQKIWSIPKGHIDEGETAKEAVIRELEEELGITVAPEDAVMVTWYTEVYRNGDSVIPVKHYIYNIKGYEGKIRNAEKNRYGKIRMLYASPEDVLKMKDVSLMTLKAAGRLTRKSAAGFLGSTAPILAASFALPSFIKMLFPGSRNEAAKSFRGDMKTLTGDADFPENTVKGAGRTLKDLWNRDWKNDIDNTVMNADRSITYGKNMASALAGQAAEKAVEFAGEGYHRAGNWFTGQV